MKSSPSHVFLGCAAMMILLTSPSEAFTMQRPAAGGPSAHVVSLGLLPDQAAALEACAYDLMKEANTHEHDIPTTTAVATHTNVLTQDISQQLQMEQQQHQRREGPVSWCRKHLLPFGGKHP